MDILHITETPMKDESIEEYEYHEYLPSTGANLNNLSDIRIIIQTQDIFTHPSESYLKIEGKLTKADGTAYADGDNIALTNNGLMYLFNNIRYHLSGQEIESLNNPGQSTTMLGLLKYPDDFSKSQGMNQLWYKDTTVAAATATNNGFAVRQLELIQAPNPKGTFSFIVPMRHIFGFCEDYNKVVYGFRHTLTLVRQPDHDAIFRANGVDAGKVTLDKVSWFMPHVMPADLEKFQLYKTIESKATIPVAYRMRQCEEISVPQTTNFSWTLSGKSSPEVSRYIIVGFQTNKNNNQETNPALFDHVNVKNIYATLNSTRYPAVDYQISFAKQQFSRAFKDAAAFRSKFYHMDELVSNPNITPSDYKWLFPLFVFDVSKQSEKLKKSFTDIQIRAFFDVNVPADTTAFAVVISDKLVNFQSDGNKLSVVY